MGATQTDDIWIVGIPGGDRRVIVTSYFPGTPDEARAQLEAMMESMTIEREWGSAHSPVAI